MKPCAFAALAASMICASVYSPGAPYAMLFRTVSLKMTVSWLTMPVRRRSEGSVKSRVSTPSTVIPTSGRRSAG
jgi:hypothetical protein